MKRIFKYDLELADVQSIEMPCDAKVLTAQLQNGKIRLWAMVSPGADKKTRHFQIIGTGHEVVDNSRLYVATVKQGIFVWNIFELLEADLLGQALYCLSQIVKMLPSRRDWLDPDIEKLANAVLAQAKEKKLLLDPDELISQSVADALERLPINPATHCNPEVKA